MYTRQLLKEKMLVVGEITRYMGMICAFPIARISGVALRILDLSFHISKRHYFIIYIFGGSLLKFLY
jgi:hypothetical protein